MIALYDKQMEFRLFI